MPIPGDFVESDLSLHALGDLVAGLLERPS
jgi:hypothetical protein